MMIRAISPQLPKYITGAITSIKTKPIPLLEILGKEAYQ
jgi:hypothetical protein